MRKVKLSSLVGHTPVTVRFEDGHEFVLRNLYELRHAPAAVSDGHGMAWASTELVEVLPAKQTPTPHTAGPWRQKEFDECQIAIFSDDPNNLLVAVVSVGEGRSGGIGNANLISIAPALLALVERMANGGWNYHETNELRADARALLAQLKTP